MIHKLVTVLDFVSFVNRLRMIPTLTQATMICTQVRLQVCLGSWVLSGIGTFINVSEQL